MSDPVDVSQDLGEENAPGLVGYVKEKQREAERSKEKLRRGEESCRRKEGRMKK